MLEERKDCAKYGVENNFANRLFGGTYPSPVLKYQRKKFVWQGQSVGGIFL